ncbi:MAG: PAP/fibrillin family protein [Cyanobacteria bacterium P01_G01_bin.39]
MTQSRDLKIKLFSQIEMLGKKQSLLPFADTSIDKTVNQLEDVAPIAQPLSINNLSALVGDWQLIYASNGTVITRPIAQVTQVLGSGIEVEQIWQSLVVEEGKITSNNQALIKLPLLGEYKLSAEGVWRSQSDQRSAMVSFHALTVKATQFLAQSDWTLPELKIPILDFLINEALWITSYLDQDMRIGRGATGNLFVFCR